MSAMNIQDASIIEMQNTAEPGSTQLLFYGEVVTFYIVVQAQNTETIKLCNGGSIVNYTDFANDESTPFSITGSGRNVHVVASGWFKPNASPYTLYVTTSSGKDVKLIIGAATPQYNGQNMGGSYIVMAEDGDDTDYNDVMVQFNWFKYQG